MDSATKNGTEAVFDFAEYSYCPLHMLILANELRHCGQQMLDNKEDSPVEEVQ